MSGRKREWSADSEAAVAPAAPPDAPEGGREGDAIEHDMKRLRLAYNYDGAHPRMCAGVWPDDDDAMETDETELPQRALAVRNDYAEANSMLRQLHFMRQLRKFQAERGRARASYLERHAEEAGAAAAWRKDPRA
ncbi:hypothetical protein PHYBOEH_001487 [Phytophthora boehmeriae]|uniref:Uncharacterized protein n=1 Tax=Phytophthora boehmeriae TaxID=109152 RepID=A0A8T1WW53_9STRA|nr:hypothetical protein PHYBOEH_001487 [Phytophthora boehmeriae]